MAINRWRPFQDLDELFEHSSRHQAFDLAVDVYCDNNNVVAKMNMPGINSEDIEIEVEENHLHIYGSREEESEVEKKDYYRKEIRRGSFERIIDLPCSVDSERTTAEFKDGVLVITMPKEAQEKASKKIKIINK